MKLICSYCHRDLNAICQDNMSHSLGTIVCEDCATYPPYEDEERMPDECVEWGDSNE